MEEETTQMGYIKNTPASKKRTLRVEVVGEVTDAEKHFLDGVAFFMAGTISKDSSSHTKYVAGMMVKLIKHVITRINKGSSGDSE